MKPYMLAAKAIHLWNVPLSASTILTECRHKLDGTYVFYDGMPARIRSIEYEHIQFRLEEHSPDDAYEVCYNGDGHTLELFNPESGAYFMKRNSVMMQKRVKKFYKKSFCPDAYIFNFIDPSSSTGDLSYFELMRTPRQEMYISGNSIYYMGVRIGALIGDMINPIDLFRTEIMEALQSGSLKVQQPLHLSKAS